MEEKQGNSAVTLSRPRRRLALTVSAFVLGVLLVYLFWPPTPETIRDRTLQALVTRDARALCRLADPDELTRLHLTPEKVEAILQQTIWRNGPPKVARMILFANKPADKRSWFVDWETTAYFHGTFGITALDHPRKGWKLVLSDVLMGACCWELGTAKGGKRYVQVARNLDIAGLRRQDGNYEIFTQTGAVLQPE